MSARLLALLTQQPCTVAMLVHKLAAPDRNVEWAILKLRRRDKISASRQAGQRYTVYSLSGAAPMPSAARLARYVPVFVPRVYDARQCPLQRAELCMTVRG